MEANLNMNIAGSGKIPSGEYNKVSVSGSGSLYGKVKCFSFSGAGSVKGESIECYDTFKASGSVSFKEEVKAKNVSIAGSFACGGMLTVEEKCSCAGSVKCKKSVKCDQLSVAGTLNVEGDIEAETVKVDGVVNCSGLLNAENIEIKIEKGMDIGSIGGSKIVVLEKTK